MKKLVILVLLTLMSSVDISADVQSLKWSSVATKQPSSWYATEEAVAVAENVLLYQRDNGGWMKNIEMHKTLSDSEKKVVESDKSGESCFDNAATTMEMRFLAKMYYHHKSEKYKEAFTKALDLILTSQRNAGAWSQYYPLRGRGYWDYLTFNDDLTVNILNLLKEISNGYGDFEGLVDEAKKSDVIEAYNKGVQCILDCQIVDNGVKTVWCAQHDPETLDPAMGRPHEFPSFSGGESVNILKFLMSIENPSEEIKEAVVKGVEWLDKNAIEGYKISYVYDEDGNVTDRVLEAAEGYRLWARFTQLGGEIAERVYKKQIEILESNKARIYNYNGKSYEYYDAENAKESYNAEYAYKPVFGIYDDNHPYLRYRFLYNYNETEKINDENGVPINTSLRADNRRNYVYLGDWAKDLIESMYPKWRLLNGLDGGGIIQVVSLSQMTHLNDWEFAKGYSISNEKEKAYATGSGNTVKFSRNVPFSINIPNGVFVSAVEFSGYSNYEEEAYLKSINGVDVSDKGYSFPGKVDGVATTVSHKIEFETPVVSSLAFEFGGQQVAVEINLYVEGGTPIKQIVVKENGVVYSITGCFIGKNMTKKDVDNLPSGLYVFNGRLVLR